MTEWSEDVYLKKCRLDVISRRMKRLESFCVREAAASADAAARVRDI